MGGGAHAYVGLGSNLGDPARQVQRALGALTKIRNTSVTRHSRCYRTAPWGVTDQPSFVNAVAELETTLAPRELLDALLAIERDQGRCRDGAQWGPRTLDLDLLTCADQQLTEPGLIVPHPRIAARAFVLVPLAELDALLLIPGAGLVRDLLARVDASDCVLID